jgi:hypothetical protein
MGRLVSGVLELPAKVTTAVTPMEAVEELVQGEEEEEPVLLDKTRPV